MIIIETRWLWAIIIIINIIIIMSRYEHGYPWPSRATLPNHLLLSAGLQPFRATSHIVTELLYVGSSWSSWFCSSMWRGPQEYITYELVPTSPAVSHVSVRLILIVSWWVVGGRTAAALWGAASRTCSILLTSFLYNCRQAFSPYVLLASM